MYVVENGCTNCGFDLSTKEVKHWKHKIARSQRNEETPSGEDMPSPAVQLDLPMSIDRI